MNIIFVDTSGFVDLIDKKGAKFEIVAKGFQDAISGGNLLVTTDYVLDELFTFMRCREKLPISDLVKFVDNVNVSNIEVVGITKELFQESLITMGKYSDKYFSFTDCISFTVMKDMGIKDFIGTDKHFEAAGFKKLLK